jgi:hypothetical protein
MTRYMHVHLSPWAEERIIKAHGSISKASIRKSLRDFPDTEFRTIATPEQPREGAVVTTREARAAGFDVLEVRFDRDRKVAMVTMSPTSTAVVVS